MKRIILAILLLPLSIYAQQFEVVRTISRSGCDLNFYNSASTKVWSLNLNELSFWNKSDGSYVLKDNKQQVNVSSLLISPSFATLTSFLNLAKDSCTSSSSTNITGLRADTICLPDPLKVSDITVQSKIDSLIGIFDKDSCVIYDVLITPTTDINDCDVINSNKYYNVYSFPIHDNASLTFTPTTNGLVIDGNFWALPQTTAPQGNGWEVDFNNDISNYCTTSNITSLSYDLTFSIDVNPALANVYVGLTDGSNQILFNGGNLILMESNTGTYNLTITPDVLPTMVDLQNYRLVILFSDQAGISIDGTRMNISYDDNCQNQIVGYSTSLSASLTECSIDALGYQFSNSTAGLATEYTLSGLLKSTNQVIVEAQKINDGTNNRRDIVYDKILNGDYIDITINDQDAKWELTLLPQYSIPVNNATVNWGDGMVEDYYSNAPPHMYSERGVYNVVFTYGEQSLRRVIRFQVRFTNSNTTIGSQVFGYEYKPVYQYYNNITNAVVYTDLANVTYTFTGLKVYDKLDVEQELKNLEIEERKHEQKVKVYYGYYEDLAVGNKVDLEDALNDYMNNYEGVSSQLRYAKKITITHRDKDDTYMHIGNSLVGDRHTKYTSKEGYTFYNDGRLYRLRDIYIYNNTSSTSTLSFTFEIEY